MEAINLIANQDIVLNNVSSRVPISINGSIPMFWRPPSPHVLKINIDASFISASEFAGIGILIRDYAGHFRKAKCVQIRSGSSEQAEGLAILVAVEWAKELKLSRVSFESDAKNLIDYINSGKGGIEWSSRTILDDSKFLSSFFDSVDFIYTHRDTNRTADILARAARLSNDGSASFDYPPYIIFDVLTSDENGIVNFPNNGNHIVASNFSL
ncbi:Ribonuclease H domain [Macleaya cordata]|uniref:Ribonuclease H domain n=1 Tax=Macleaya cordata TaxID=56857 RepID=A0A200QMM0_MACCD|nr:Ribonuclease H domain [Macleaya cordata]